MIKYMHSNVYIDFYTIMKISFPLGVFTAGYISKIDCLYYAVVYLTFIFMKSKPPMHWYCMICILLIP